MSALPEMSPEAKIMAAHMAATAAVALQVLVTTLQEAGALQPGAFPETLRVYIDGLHRCGNAAPMVMTLLGDLRKAPFNWGFSSQ